MGTFCMVPYTPRYDRTIGIYDVPCMICFLYGSSSNEVMLRECCQGTICRNCLKRHFECKVEQGIVKVVCPLENCDRLAKGEEIAAVVSEPVLDKYRRFCVDLENNPNIKTCPNCSRIYKHDIIDEAAAEKSGTDEERDESQKDSTKTIAQKLKVTCLDCELVWCFSCQAPWHYGLTCKEFYKGDKSLKIWAKNRGQPCRNAQRCPKCQVYIQKFAGCDHMTCGRCNTEFCYQCGARYRSIKFLGDHYDPLSIFGCKYNFKPDKPTQRIATRCAILSGKLLVLPLVVGLAAGAGCVLFGAGVLAAPVYGSYKLIKAQREKHKHKPPKRPVRCGKVMLNLEQSTEMSGE